MGLGNRKTIGDNELPSTITSINLGTARVKKISLGSGFACALLDNGDVKCWGQNNFGQLGVGNTDTIGDNEHPASQSAVNLPEDVVDISTGEDFACALLKSGSLKCWGQTISVNWVWNTLISLVTMKLFRTSDPPIQAENPLWFIRDFHFSDKSKNFKSGKF